MVVSYLLDDDNNVIPLIIFTAGIPVACAVGAFAAGIILNQFFIYLYINQSIDRRFKYLCDPSLLDGVMSGEEMQSLPVQLGKKKKSVNFEQPKANKLLKNKLYSRLRYYFTYIK